MNKYHFLFRDCPRYLILRVAQRVWFPFGIHPPGDIPNCAPLTSHNTRPCSTWRRTSHLLKYLQSVSSRAPPHQRKIKTWYMTSQLANTCQTRSIQATRCPQPSLPPCPNKQTKLNCVQHAQGYMCSRATRPGMRKQVAGPCCCDSARPLASIVLPQPSC